MRCVPGTAVKNGTEALPTGSDAGKEAGADATRGTRKPPGCAWASGRGGGPGARARLGTTKPWEARAGAEVPGWAPAAAPADTPAAATAAVSEAEPEAAPEAAPGAALEAESEATPIAVPAVAQVSAAGPTAAPAVAPAEVQAAAPETALEAAVVAASDAEFWNAAGAETVRGGSRGTSDGGGASRSGTCVILAPGSVPQVSKAADGGSANWADCSVPQTEESLETDNAAVGLGFADTDGISYPKMAKRLVKLSAF